MDTDNKYTLEYFKNMVKQTKTTYGELAVFFDVDERTVYRWMAGRTRIPRAVFMVLEMLLKSK
jgi:hypothetical protein